MQLVINFFIPLKRVCCHAGGIIGFRSLIFLVTANIIAIIFIAIIYYYIIIFLAIANIIAIISYLSCPVLPKSIYFLICPLPLENNPWGQHFLVCHLKSMLCSKFKIHGDIKCNDDCGFSGGVRRTRTLWSRVLSFVGGAVFVYLY